MSGVSGLSGVDRVMAMRSQILERNAALQRANANPTTPSTIEAGGAKPAGSFGDTLDAALKSVNQSQAAAQRASEAYERGDTVDIAKVMLARQQASLAFEATLQVRNKLLSAYKDIMSMPV